MEGPVRQTFNSAHRLFPISSLLPPFVTSSLIFAFSPHHPLNHDIHPRNKLVLCISRRNVRASCQCPGPPLTAELSSEHEAHNFDISPSDIRPKRRHTHSTCAAQSPKPPPSNDRSHRGRGSTTFIAPSPHPKCGSAFVPVLPTSPSASSSQASHAPSAPPAQLPHIDAPSCSSRAGVCAQPAARSPHPVTAHLHLEICWEPSPPKRAPLCFSWRGPTTRVGRPHAQIRDATSPRLSSALPALGVLTSAYSSMSRHRGY